MVDVDCRIILKCILFLFAQLLYLYVSLANYMVTVELYLNVPYCFCLQSAINYMLTLNVLYCFCLFSCSINYMLTVELYLDTIEVILPVVIMLYLANASYQNPELVCYI